MKTLAIGSFLVLFAIVSGITAMPSAFAAEVGVPSGTGTPGCEETNECWDPAELTIDVGETVTWSNDDTAAHTVTSGSPVDGPDGNFDSSLFLAGATYDVTFDTAGEFPYFCMVHPWMIGTVIVGEAMGEEVMMEDEAMIEDEAMMEDESLVKIETGVGNANEPLEITVTIGDSDGTTQDVHANFNIKAIQGDDVVLDETIHSMSGMEVLTTSALPLDASDEMPVNVNVEFLGYGVGDDLTGTPEAGNIQVVPEFGTIAMMVLGVGIISIIALSAKSKLIPKL